jgi:hypothetical protein
VPRRLYTHVGYSFFEPLQGAHSKPALSSDRA